jgi:hypothetical protein
MDWPMFRRVERQAVRMHEMMDRLDVDPAEFARLRQGDVYAEARTRCLHCGTTDKCLRWLEDINRAGTSPDFCPNLQLFEASPKRRDTDAG